MRQQLIVPMEVKSVDDAGQFSGYASIFGNVDEGYDVVEKGAFKKFAKTRDGKIRVLFQHDAYGRTQSAGLPIGKATVEQDEKGLAFDGQLVMDDPFVQRVHTHLKAKTLDGMSIGFDILPGGAEFTEGGVRKLKALHLWEISVVTFGMNPKARVEAVKRAGQITTIREYEDFLREEAGFSNAQAKLLAAGGYKALQSARDESGEVKAAQQLTELVERLQFPTFTLER